MNRAILLCVLLCVLGACESDSSPSSSQDQVASSSTTGNEHLACVEEGGFETGEIPEPLLRVEGQDVSAHYVSGYRAPCPEQVVEGTATTLMALDGGTLPGPDGGGDVDVEVVTGTPLTVSIRPWSEDITVDFIHSSELSDPGVGRDVSWAEVGPGLWRLDVSPDPGDYVLSLRFHWEYGEDSWGWHIRVVE